MITTEQIITQTKKWITDVVIGCNFCPFVAKEIKKQDHAEIKLLFEHYKILSGLESLLKTVSFDSDLVDVFDNILEVDVDKLSDDKTKIEIKEDPSSEYIEMMLQLGNDDEKLIKMVKNKDPKILKIFYK